MISPRHVRRVLRDANREDRRLFLRGILLYVDQRGTPYEIHADGSASPYATGFLATAGQITREDIARAMRGLQ